MGLRPAGTLVQLPDLKGELIALKFIDEVTRTHKPAWANGEEREYTVPRAEVVQITRPAKKGEPFSARAIGRTLVFPVAVANEIKGSSEWAVGTLELTERPTDAAPDGTMYTLEYPTDVDSAVLEAAFEAAGIAL